MKKQVKALHLDIKWWYDSKNNNSYYSVMVTVNNEEKITIPFSYGYEEDPLYEVIDELKEQGFFPKNISPFTTLARYCQYKNINLTIKEENCLKRDLIQG